MPTPGPGTGTGTGPLICWLLDTRPLWPTTGVINAISTVAPEALALLSPEERSICLRKYQHADAKMSLASSLLKRLFVHKTLGYPWHSIRFGRKRDPKHGKPCALLPHPTVGPAPCEFNVSHQAGLVVLVGCATRHLDAELGVDIVCVGERNDGRAVRETGFESWVDMFSPMFSEAELFDIKFHADAFTLPSGGSSGGAIVTPNMLDRQDRCTALGEKLSVLLPSGTVVSFDSDVLVQAKLRRFYAFWCCKEAYIKLDGEAMLADWIPRLEFRGVAAPFAAASDAAGGDGDGDDARLSWGDRVSDIETYFEGSLLDGVKVDLRAYEDCFMIGVAARIRKWEDGVGVGEVPSLLTGFEQLDVEEVIQAATTTTA